MENWANFFIATATVSAALSGLIYVGISINLHKVLQIVGAPERAWNALTLLLAMMLFSLLMLVPGEAHLDLGWEILGVGILACALIAVPGFSANARKSHKNYASVLVDLVATILYVVAGGLIIAGQMNGVYLLVPAFALSLWKALWDAWILMIEINRRKLD
jgi:modulator of FtsH protease